MSNRPKPTRLKELEGNPGKRALNANEPTPETAAPKCPSHLKGEARREWNRIVPELLALGLLTRIDKAALASYCSAWATYVEADAKIKEAGLVVRTKQGNVIANPYLGARNTAMKLMKGFLIEFGLTPAARSHLNVPTPTQAASPWDGLMAGGGSN